MNVVVGCSAFAVVFNTIHEARAKDTQAYKAGNGRQNDKVDIENLLQR